MKSHAAIPERKYLQRVSRIIAEFRNYAAKPCPKNSSYNPVYNRIVNVLSGQRKLAPFCKVFKDEIAEENAENKNKAVVADTERADTYKNRIYIIDKHLNKSSN